jgi:hypothetical protein
VKHSATRELYAYWDGLRGARAAPEQAHVQPAALRRILGDLFVLEVDPGREFPFRLAGTRICDLFARELRRSPFLDLFGRDDRQPIRDALAAVIEDAAVAVTGLCGHTERGWTAEAELVLLPLRHHGQTHARVIGSIGLSQRPAWVGGVPLTTFSVDMLRLTWPSGRRRAFGDEPQDLPPGSDAPTRPQRSWLRVLEGGLAARKSG